VFDFLKSDEAFHALIIESCGNDAIKKIVSDYRALSKLMMANRFSHTVAQTDTTLEQHAAVLDAIRRQDPRDAGQAMKEHIRFSRDAVLQQTGEAADPGAVIPEPADRS
jgi:GntR family transcriptional repressor for pyruvate dehydrogenase complex